MYLNLLDTVGWLIVPDGLTVVTNLGVIHYCVSNLANS